MKKKIIIVLIILMIIIISLGLWSYYYVKTPILAIPTYISKEYEFKREKFKERDIYIISPKENKSNQFILYQHGGAYATNLTSTYWDFFAKIVTETEATMIIPDYPLTPEFYYKDVFEMMEPLYEEIIKRVGAENLIVMGDSAGGGLSLALCQREGEKEVQQPKRLILISPWLDVTMTNKQIDEVQPKDPLLNKDILKVAGKAYARGMDEKDYHISPIYGPLNKLKNITIYTGTYDILNPDAKRFRKKAQTEGLEIEYKEYEEAIHIWLLSYKDDSIYKAKEACQDLIQSIKEEKNEK